RRRPNRRPSAMLRPALTSILHRVAAGDRSAVRECLTRYGGLVWSLARRAAPNQTDAEAAGPEVFLDLLPRAGRLHPAVASEPTFIAMIARRRLIDRARRRQRRRDTEALQPENLPSEQPLPELGIEAQQAARALALLRPEQREVLVLTTCHGLSHEEVA